MSMPPDQRQQQVEGLRSERDGRAIAQQEAFRRIQAEGAEFIDVLWLLAHRCFGTPPIKGPATPARKYPGSLRQATPAADHLASNQYKLRRPLAPTGIPSGWPIARSSGRQSLLEKGFALPESC